MRLGVYSVYDDKACVFYPPFTAKTDGEARRIFAVGVQDSNTSVGMFPADFSLYRLGSFDDSSGALEAIVPEFMSRGSEHVKSILVKPVTPDKSG